MSCRQAACPRLSAPPWSRTRSHAPAQRHTARAPLVPRWCPAGARATHPRLRAGRSCAPHTPVLHTGRHDTHEQTDPADTTDTTDSIRPTGLTGPTNSTDSTQLAEPTEPNVPLERSLGLGQHSLRGSVCHDSMRGVPGELHTAEAIEHVLQELPAQLGRAGTGWDADVAIAMRAADTDHNRGSWSGAELVALIFRMLAVSAVRASRAEVLDTLRGCIDVV